MNPTQDVLEQRIAALEGGAAALALASGTSAVYYSIINICQAGDEIVSATNLYGGTYTMFNGILPQFGIQVNFTDAGDPDNFAKAITEKTRAIFIETIGNPVLDFTDISAVAEIAHSHNLPLIVDATFTTPYLLKTIEHGADIVVNSLTKWMGDTAPVSAVLSLIREISTGRIQNLNFTTSPIPATTISVTPMISAT